MTIRAQNPDRKRSVPEWRCLVIKTIPIHPAVALVKALVCRHFAVQAKMQLGNVQALRPGFGRPVPQSTEHEQRKIVPRLQKLTA